VSAEKYRDMTPEEATASIEAAKAALPKHDPSAPRRALDPAKADKRKPSERGIIFGATSELIEPAMRRRILEKAAVDAVAGKKLAAKARDAKIAGNKNRTAKYAAVAVEARRLFKLNHDRFANDSAVIDAIMPDVEKFARSQGLPAPKKRTVRTYIP
jgi:hypothetical protein